VIEKGLKNQMMFLKGSNAINEKPCVKNQMMFLKRLECHK
jgi:hypothetical protein